MPFPAYLLDGTIPSSNLKRKLRTSVTKLQKLRGMKTYAAGDVELQRRLEQHGAFEYLKARVGKRGRSCVNYALCTTRRPVMADLLLAQATQAVAGVQACRGVQGVVLDTRGLCVGLLLPLCQQRGSAGTQKALHGRPTDNGHLAARAAGPRHAGAQQPRDSAAPPPAPRCAPAPAACSGKRIRGMRLSKYMAAEVEVDAHTLSELRIAAKDLGQEHGVKAYTMGQVEIKRRLGNGGFGQVFKVRARKNNAWRTFALKTALSPEGVRLLPKEARMQLAAGAHVNVLGMPGMVLDRRGLCVGLLMPLCEGTLKEWWKAEQPTDMEAVRLVQGLVAGLAVLHDNMIVHRDIKPDNLLVCREGPDNEATVKLADFGLAHYMHDDAAWSRAGTCLYMAPEVLVGAIYATAATDAYAVGCTILELSSVEQALMPSPAVMRRYEHRQDCDPVSCYTVAMACALAAGEAFEDCTPLPSGGVADGMEGLAAIAAMCLRPPEQRASLATVQQALAALKAELQEQLQGMQILHAEMDALLATC